jgi:hypothetical protein
MCKIFLGLTGLTTTAVTVVMLSAAAGTVRANRLEAGRAAA